MIDQLLDVQNLKVVLPTRKGRLTAVDDVSFSLTAGEVLGLVGESGVGKSLTGAAIIGLLDPPLYIENGRIYLDERIDTLSDEALRRIRGKRIGSIFQDPLTSLNPLYSVGRQLVQTITTHIDVSRTRAKARAAKLLKDVAYPRRRSEWITTRTSSREVCGSEWSSPWHCVPIPVSSSRTNPHRLWMCPCRRKS